MSEKLNKKVAVSDKSEKISSEKRHLKAEDKFYKLFNFANDAVFIIDIETGMIVDANRKTGEIIGCHPDELLGMHHTKIYPAKDRKTYSEMFQNLNDGDSFIANNIVLSGKDGEKLPVELSASVIDINGRKVMKAIFRDIEVRKKIESNLLETQEKLSDEVNNNVFELAKAIKVIQSEFRKRREAEKKYDNLNNYNDLILNSAGDGICGLDKKGDITFLNPAGARMLGWTKDELVNKNFHKLFHHIRKNGHFLEWKDCPIKITLSEGITSHAEDDYFSRKDGSLFPVDYLCTPIFENGEILGAVLTFSDISEQKRSEEQLKLTQAILDNVGDTACLIGDDGKFIYVNNSFCTSIGYSREEMLHMRVPDIDPLFPEEVWDEHWETVKKRGTMTFESAHKTKDGKIYPVELTVNFLNYNSKEYIIAFARDIRFRKKSLEALKESELKFRSVAQTASDGIISIDSEGIVVSWNRGAERIFGFKAGEIEGKSLALVIPERFKEKFKSGFGYIVDSEDRSFMDKSVELTGLRKDGEEFPLELSIAFWKSNNKVFFSAIIRDITQRKESEKEIKMHAARAESLVRAATSLNSCIEYEKVLETVCTETAKALDAPAVSLFLYDDVTDTFQYSASRGLPHVYDEKVSPLTGEIYNRYFKVEEQVTLISDLNEIPEMVNCDLYKSLRVNMIATATMVRENNVVGFIQVLWFDDRQSLNKNETELLKGLAHLSALALSNSILFKNSLSHLEKLQALHDIDNTIATNIDLKSTLDIILSTVRSHLGVDAADILLLDSEYRRFECVASMGFRREYEGLRGIDTNDGYAAQVLLNNKIQFIPNIQNSPLKELRFQQFVTEKLISYCAVPLFVKGEITGVLEVFKKTLFDPNMEWVSYLETLAEQAAIAIDNCNLLNELQISNVELESAYDTTLEGWSKALDLRDKETEGHTQRVADMSVKLASCMNISGDELVDIRRGALLHDIGKMGIPDRILLKPDKLTEKEWKVMKMHPVFAYELLTPIRYLKKSIEIPYCHHEKWSGEGYPRGLKGEEIPMPARIFAVVDIWDALCSDRPYRSAWNETKAIEYLRAIAGDHLDPEIVKKFLEVLAHSM